MWILVFYETQRHPRLHDTQWLTLSIDWRAVASYIDISTVKFFPTQIYYKKQRAKYDHSVKKRNINNKKNVTDARWEGIAFGNSAVFR